MSDIEFVKLRKLGDKINHVVVEITTKNKLPEVAVLVRKADKSKPGLLGLAEYAIGTKDQIDAFFGISSKDKGVPLTKRKKDFQPWTPKVPK